MKWLAPAKINLSLRVLGRRDDGYHELETWMVPLDLADEIEIVPLSAGNGSPGGFELVCSDPTLPTGRENLAVRAAESFQAHLGKPLSPARITLQKHIPHGAGLGGGSSDAAAVLLALNEMSGQALNMFELASLAAELGSDIPFFLCRSAAMCRGRGERVEPLALPRPIPLLLLKPAFGVPTPWAYQHWKDARELPSVLYEPQVFPWGVLRNDLERPVFEKYLLLPEIKMWLLTQPGVAGALMSGSGSTMIAVLRDRGDAPELIARAQAVFGDLWACPCATASR